MERRRRRDYQPQLPLGVEMRRAPRPGRPVDRGRRSAEGDRTRKGRTAGSEVATVDARAQERARADARSAARAAARSAEEWRIDESTRLVGRRGLAAARAALARSGPDGGTATADAA